MAGGYGTLRGGSSQFTLTMPGAALMATVLPETGVHLENVGLANASDSRRNVTMALSLHGRIGALRYFDERPIYVSKRKQRARDNCLHDIGSERW